MKKILFVLFTFFIHNGVSFAESIVENIELDTKIKKDKIIPFIAELKKLNESFKSFLENELKSSQNIKLELEDSKENDYDREYRKYLENLKGVYINGDMRYINNKDLEFSLGLEYRLLRRGKEEIKNKIITNEIESLIKEFDFRNKNNLEFLSKVDQFYLQKRIYQLDTLKNTLYRSIVNTSTALKNIDKSWVFPFFDNLPLITEKTPEIELNLENNDSTIPIIKRIKYEKILQLYLQDKENYGEKIEKISKEEKNLFLSEYKDLNIFTNVKTNTNYKNKDLSFSGGISFSFPLSKDIINREKLLTKAFFYDRKSKINKEIEEIYSKAYEYSIDINHYSSILEFNIYSAKIILSEIERDIYLTENGLTEPKYPNIFKNFLDLLVKFDNIVYYKFIVYLKTKKLLKLLNLPYERYGELIEYGKF